MSHHSDDSEFNFESLGTFLGDHRAWIFKKPTKAARYFALNHGYVYHYEADTRLPPLGYVASIVRLYDERLIRTGLIDEDRRRRLLKQLEYIVRHYYQEELPFTDWVELMAAADQYMESRWGKNWRLRLIEVLQIPPLENLLERADRFIGYEKNMAELLTRLTSDDKRIFVEGVDGIGKTWLALEAGHRCLVGPNMLFGVVVWISAKDQPERQVWFEEVLDKIAETLRFPFLRPISIDDKQKVLERHLKSHHTLIIIDNFNTVEDPSLETWIEDVTQNTPIKFLFTSRFVHRSLFAENTHVIRLEGLEKTAALEFARRCARAERLNLAGATDDELMPLIVAAAGNPQIIRAALGYYAYVSDFERAVDYAMKRDEFWDRRWDELTEDARKLLLVSPFFTDSMSGEVLGAAAGVTGEDLYQGLERLIRIQLLDILENTIRIRYGIHPMVREFATGKLDNETTFARLARERWSNYLLSYAKQHLVSDVVKARYWNSLFWDPSPAGGLTPIDREWPNLREALRWFDENSEDHLLVELFMIIVHFMDKRAHFRERIRYALKAADAAHRLNRPADEAWIRIDSLGWTYMEEGCLQEAHAQIESGLSMAIELLQGAEGHGQSDTAWETAHNLVAIGHAFLARMHLKGGNVEAAKQSLQRVPEAKLWHVIEARIYVIQGDISFAIEDYDQAITCYKKATSVSRIFEGGGWHELGFAYLRAGYVSMAEEAFGDVLSAYDADVTIEVIHAKYGLACVAKKRGDIENARLFAEQALEWLSGMYAEHRLVNEIEQFLNSPDD